MQETQYQVDQETKRLQEFFSGENIEDLFKQMDSRLEELEAIDHTLVGREVLTEDQLVKKVSSYKRKGKW